MRWRLDKYADEGIVGAEPAAEAFAELVEALSALRDGEALEFDAEGVLAVSHDFVANAVGRVLVWFKTGFVSPTPTVLVNAGPLVAEAFNGVFREHEMSLLHCKTDGDYELLGVADVLAETTSAAQELGTFTLTEFAVHIGMTKQGADKRLRALVQAGALLRRVDGPGSRRSPIYQLPRLGTSAAAPS